MPDLSVYGVIAQHETDRLPAFMQLCRSFARFRVIDAVYPRLRKVPWQSEILAAGRSRCNRQLSLGELGCLLSHRKAWKTFLNSHHTHALIFESDSKIRDVGRVNRVIRDHAEGFDIIFLGSYHGRTKLKRSSSQVLEDGGKLGVPLPNTLYCAYGYLINKTAARYLLKRTAQVTWPVDYWREWLRPDGADYLLRIAAVVPEIVSAWDAPSMIQDSALVHENEKLPRRFRYFLGEVYNSFVGYLC